MPEPDVRAKMEAMCQSIQSNVLKLERLGLDKAQAIRDYDKKIAIIMLGLREGENYKVGDKQVREPPPVSILEKLAKGLASEEKFKLDLAESAYKSCHTKIEAAKAILNAQQSIWRHSE